MKLLPAFAILMAVLSTPALLAADWKKELARPLVKVVGNKMVFEELELCTESAKKGAEQTSFQVKTRSEAPQGKFISRDYFVAITAMLKAEILAQFGNIECKTLESPIGTPDLEITVVMAQEGLQIETSNTGTGQKNRNTVRWEDMFAE